MRRVRFPTAVSLLLVCVVGCESEPEPPLLTSYGVTNRTTGQIEVEWNADTSTQTLLFPGWATNVGTVRRDGTYAPVSATPLWCLRVRASGQLLFHSSDIPTRLYETSDDIGGKLHLLPIDSELLALPPSSDNCMGAP